LTTAYTVLGLNETEFNAVEERDHVRFESLGLRIEFPGGKEKNVGAEFHILVLKNEDVGPKGARKISSAKIEADKQSIVVNWDQLKTSYVWDPPTEGNAHLNYDERDYKHVLAIVVRVHVMRTNCDPKATLARIQGFWKFSADRKV